MSTATQLLGRTDQLARDLLAAPDTSAGLGPYRSWQDMMHQAAEAWRAADATFPVPPAADPFLGIQAMVNNGTQPSAHHPEGIDARAAALTIQLGRLTSHYRFKPDRSGPVAVVRTERVQGSVLHASYLITHAAGLALRRELAVTKGSALVADIRRARDTLGVAEQILDVHLHHPPSRPASDQQLDRALSQWTVTAHQILSEAVPEPKNNYIISDVQHGLLVHTAALLAPPGRHDHTSRDLAAEARERLLPALRHSADNWGQVRQAWARLAAPTTGISRGLADAARTLHQALRDPELDRRGNAGHLIAGTLGVAVETARGLADAFNSDQLRAPTDVVVTLTRGALNRLPEANSYQVWIGMTRHAGRAPIALPVPLREDLTRTALRNVEAAQTVRSAAHVLLETSSRIPPAVYRVRSPGVQAADRAITTRPRDTVGPRR
ncbi:MAG: hypothetical protein ACR2LI_05130 [Propionibacteriaceae bacterium]